MCMKPSVNYYSYIIRKIILIPVHSQSVEMEDSQPEFTQLRPPFFSSILKRPKR